MSVEQVGGVHYQSTYPHWDWVLDINLGYLEGCATKYLARLDKKPGEARQEALAKVRSYIEKTEENAARLLLRPRMPRRWIDEKTNAFCKANEIEDEAYVAVLLLSRWECPSDLREAKRLIQKLMGAGTVPLEDSNKHALQKVEDDDNH